MSSMKAMPPANGAGTGAGAGSSSAGIASAASARSGAARGMKRPADTPLAGTMQEMKIIPLGAGAEVGRSCHILKYKGKTIMFDCGIHPGYSGENAKPYLDSAEVELSEIDILFVSHFHLDHAASVPYLTERTTFKGRVFATHPTKAVMKLLLSDYIRVSGAGSAEDDSRLYTEAQLNSCMNKIETADFLQTLVVEGIKFQFLNAGHVLGAAMILVEVAGVRVLYTGDYSCEEDRHLMAAKPPTSRKPHVLIVEATYGVMTHMPRERRERRFTQVVEDTVLAGGRCLIPVFALGRAQELLLILEEHWRANARLQQVPIYFHSKLANESLKVFQTYLQYMNSRIQGSTDRNPFRFRHISNLRSERDFEDDGGPVVVLATPGMLQSGLSRRLFDRWCMYSNNSVVLAGYSVKGTLANDLLENPSQVKALDGRPLNVKCSTTSISFSAHADFDQTSQFVDALQPPKIVLVHGEKNTMRRLRDALRSKYRDNPGFEIFMPDSNEGELVTLSFREERIAKAIGRVAARTITTGARVQGLIVARDFQYTVLDPVDVEKVTELVTHQVKQTQHIPFRQSFPVLRMFLESMYEDVEEYSDPGFRCLLVCGKVTVSYRPPDRVMLSWMASPSSDMVADSIAAVVLQASLGIAGMKAVTTPCTKHAHEAASDEAPTQPSTTPARPALTAAQAKVLQRGLAEHFDTVDMEPATSSFTVKHFDAVAVVNHSTGEVQCDNPDLAARVKVVLHRIDTALFPSVCE